MSGEIPAPPVLQHFPRLEADQVAKRARDALRESDLDAFWQCLAINPARAAPYHNEYHALKCVALCAEGARFEHLDRSGTRSVLLAALFHDYDHSAGRFSEAQNIEAAVGGLTMAIARFQLELQRPLSLPEVAGAVSAIEASAHPHRRDDVRLIARILRDADAMQPYETDTVRLVDQFVGLKQEQERLRDRVQSISEFADEVEAQHRRTSWATGWAKARADALSFDTKYVDRLSGLLRSASISFHTLRPRPRLPGTVLPRTQSSQTP